MKKDKCTYEKDSFYNVLCTIDYVEEFLPEEDQWRKEIKSNKYTVINPLIEHLHHDKENGQELFHYHQDDRFIHNNQVWLEDGRINKVPITIYVPVRIFPDKNTQYKIIKLKCIRDKVMTITPVNLIAKSKLNHKCIYKGKCAHRGYDLIRETPIIKIINGKETKIITCPLHGLTYDYNTKKLLVI